MTTKAKINKVYVVEMLVDGKWKPTAESSFMLIYADVKRLSMQADNPDDNFRVKYVSEEALCRTV
jgi:hypothetical protein